MSAHVCTHNFTHARPSIKLKAEKKPGKLLTPTFRELSRGPGVLARALVSTGGILPFLFHGYLSPCSGDMDASELRPA